MSATMEEKDPFELLGEKMVKEIQDGHPYEAFQLAMSYVARKKKHLGRSVTSSLVFHAAGVLIKNNASADAGSLLSWYIEDGAGDDYYFKLEEGDITAPDTYCDAMRLADLLATVSPTAAFPVVEKIYAPIHKLMVKKRINRSSALWARLSELELSWIIVFEANKAWPIAYKAVVRIGDMERAARILNSWADDAYASERPLFFARAVFQLLADGSIAKADDLLKKSAQYVVDDLELSPSDPRCGPLSMWHLATILSNLAVMEPKARVDKGKIFGLATSKYAPLIQKVDPKLILLFDKIGQNAFGLRSQTEQANPMAALFQNMMAGATAPPGKKKKGPTGPGGLDLNAMMSMMNALQGASK